MPILPQELSVKLADKCQLKKTKLNVLSPDRRKLSFQYKLCENDKAIEFVVTNQNHISHKGKSLFVVDSMRHHTPESYMQAMADNADRDRCYAVQTPEGLWLLIDSLENRPMLYGPHGRIENNACGRYKGSEKPEGWVFAFNDGVVFGFKQENTRNFIELSSITYTETLNE